MADFEGDVNVTSAASVEGSDGRMAATEQSEHVEVNGVVMVLQQILFALQTNQDTLVQQARVIQSTSASTTGEAFHPQRLNVFAARSFLQTFGADALSALARACRTNGHEYLCERLNEAPDPLGRIGRFLEALLDPAGFSMNIADEIAHFEAHVSHLEPALRAFVAELSRAEHASAHA